MGIVDVTPGARPDGGRLSGAESAVAHARRLAGEGAAVVDIGGEGTRPGAEPLSEEVELARVLPVIEALAGTLGGVEISVDTTNPVVAEAALSAGAAILNDRSSSLEEVAAAHGAGWVAMYRPGPPAATGDDPRDDDVVEEVAEYLDAAARRGRRAGVGRIWIDPGVGAASTSRALELVANLDRFARSAAVVVGVSRTRFVGRLHAGSDGLNGESAVTDPDDRLEGSLAMATWSAHLGADMVRAHDVRATVHAVRVVQP